MNPEDQKESTVPVRDAQGRFVKGFSGNPIGKPQGAVSRLTHLKEDFLTVYDEMGGKDGLIVWAKDHPTEFYTMLFKLLPRPVSSVHEVAEISYEERLLQTFLVRKESQDDFSKGDGLEEGEDETE